MADKSKVKDFVNKFPLVSDQVSQREVEIILAHLDKTLQNGVPGHVVEFGCYTGTTSLFLQRWIGESGEKRELHVYDSFAGLPDKSEQDSSPAGTQFKRSELIATKSQFILNFKKADLPTPKIHKGWFGDLTDADIPLPIAFAFLDGDFYESIRDSLKLVWPKLSPGAVVVVDDYMNEQLPGAKKAVDEWLKAHPHKRLHVEHSLAVIELD